MVAPKLARVQVADALAIGLPVAAVFVNSSERHATQTTMARWFRAVLWPAPPQSLDGIQI